MKLSHEDTLLMSRGFEKGQRVEYHVTGAKTNMQDRSEPRQGPEVAS